MTRNDIRSGVLWVRVGDVMRAEMWTVALVLGAFLALLQRLAARILPFYIEPSVTSVSLSMSKGCFPSFFTRSAKKGGPSTSTRRETGTGECFCDFIKNRMTLRFGGARLVKRGRAVASGDSPLQGEVGAKGGRKGISVSRPSANFRALCGQGDTPPSAVPAATSPRRGGSPTGKSDGRTVYTRTRRAQPIPAHPEHVEGLFFLLEAYEKKGQPFDKLRASGGGG
jgi:hypothetical protein